LDASVDGVDRAFAVAGIDFGAGDVWVALDVGASHRLTLSSHVVGR